MVLVDRGFFDPLFANEPWPIIVRIPVWVRPGTVIATLQSLDALISNDVNVQFKIESGKFVARNQSYVTNEQYIVHK